MSAPQQNQLMEYEIAVTKMRHGPRMDYPNHVHLETFAKCNAACNFCPYPKIERQGARMSDELLEKVITDLREIPRQLSFMLSPFKVNEPFLDKRLFPLLESVNRNLPNANLTLTTNASPLTAEKIEQLRSIRNIGYVWISFNDHREKEYEETMQLPYKRTLERIDMLHREMLRQPLPFRVVVSRVSDGDREADNAFCQWVRQRYPRFAPGVTTRGDWLGEVSTDTGAVPNVPCMRWFEISIMADGRVAHCCMDGMGKWSVGDVREHSVLEIYNSHDYRALRERTVSRRFAEPCNSCTFL